MCQHQASLLMQIKPKLDHLGIPLIAVGNGSKRFALKFKTALEWEGPIYLDTECNTFKALQLQKLTIWQAIKRFFGIRAYYKQLSKVYTSADLEGDGTQTGGVFVLGPGVGRPLRFSFRENDNEADVFAANDEILKAAGWTKEHKEKEQVKEKDKEKDQEKDTGK